MTTLTLISPDISCEKCKANIEGDLSGLEGVRSIEVEVVTKAVRVDYDESVIDAGRLRDALSKAGYPAES
jgi:copper chaperone CopZ